MILKYYSKKTFMLFKLNHNFSLNSSWSEEEVRIIFASLVSLPRILCGRIICSNGADHQIRDSKSLQKYCRIARSCWIVTYTVLDKSRTFHPYWFITRLQLKYISWLKYFIFLINLLYIFRSLSFGRTSIVNTKDDVARLKICMEQEMHQRT